MTEQYKVVEHFTLNSDNERYFAVGDVYPHSGKEIDEADVKKLLGDNPKKKVYIEKVEVANPLEDLKINELRKLAKEKEIKNYNKLKKAELIEKLGE